ncbi:MAG TPA: sugar phosphate isomerase/epimerase family protein [bacterium]|nr:sugar phosphate isomerase/epimerase family protein [bacterium]HQL63770.1 sugar phosphate isomerase/epimerase family protein [bacterium]
MYLSVSSYLWLQEPFLQHIHTVSRAGFDSLEIFASRRHLDLRNPDVVQEAGLALRRNRIRRVTLHAPKIGIDLSSPNLMQRKESLEFSFRVLDAATLLGVSLVTFHPSGVECSPKETPMRWPALMSSLRDLSRYASDRDLSIALENHPRPLFCDDPVELVARIEALCAENVGISLDLGHAYVNGQLPSCIRYLGSSLKAVQASDNTGHSDSHLFPGTGDLPWEQVFAALIEEGFNGPIVIEIKDERPLGVVLEDLNRFADEMGLVGVKQMSS